MSVTKGKLEHGRQQTGNVWPCGRITGIFCKEIASRNGGIFLEKSPRRILAISRCIKEWGKELEAQDSHKRSQKGPGPRGAGAEFLSNFPNNSLGQKIRRENEAGQKGVGKRVLLP